MSLRDELYDAKGRTGRKRRLKLDILLERMDEDDREAALEYLRDRDMPALVLTRVLRKHGIDISHDSVRRWRMVKHPEMWDEPTG